MERTCEHCDSPLKQRDNEKPGRFRQRRFCSKRCAAAVNGELGANAVRRPLEEKFWEKVDKRADDECWPWLAGLSLGYGQMGHLGKHRWAHRVSYELHNGPIPDGLQIDHLCRNRACVNPAHLEVVTIAENLHRGEGFGQRLYSQKTHCKHGHPLSGENLYVAPDGHRHCKTCRRAVDRRRYRASQRTPS